MKKGFLLVTLGFILFLSSLFVLSNAQAQNDSSRVEWRNFDAHAIDQYKKQTDFIYDRTQETSGFSFWQWISYLLNKLFSTTQQNAGMKIIFYAVMIIAIVAIVINLAGIDIRKIFTRESQAALAHAFIEENIREMNIDDLIAEAIANKEWRLCVRYQYLKALRLLTDKELINWQAGKTNMDYYYELKGVEVKDGFLDVTGKFENAWYGNQDVTQQDYQLARTGFEQFYEKLNRFRV